MTVTELFEENFNVHKYEDTIELETWTEGGVNMFITIDDNQEHIKQFKKYVEDFDIDEEIDLHRQGSLYRNNFTIRQSLRDFKKYHKWLKKLVKALDNDNN